MKVTAQFAYLVSPILFYPLATVFLVTLNVWLAKMEPIPTNVPAAGMDTISVVTIVSRVVQRTASLVQMLQHALNAIQVIHSLRTTINSFASLAWHLAEPVLKDSHQLAWLVVMGFILPVKNVNHVLQIALNAHLQAAQSALMDFLWHLNKHAPKTVFYHALHAHHRTQHNARAALLVIALTMSPKRAIRWLHAMEDVSLAPWDTV